MINDVRDCYTYKIREVGNYKHKEDYAKLYENGVLKDEFKIVEEKKLTHALSFPQNFKTK